MGIFAQDVRPCAARVTYNRYAPKASEVQVQEVERSVKPVRPNLYRSPQGTKWLEETYPDTTKEGPWSTTLLVGDNHGSLVKIIFPNHGQGGVHSEWLNEKLLFVQIWGHIASIDLIFDVERASFIYSETAYYGQVGEPCKED
jgi:hypothetical protein